MKVFLTATLALFLNAGMCATTNVVIKDCLFSEIITTYYVDGKAVLIVDSEGRVIRVEQNGEAIDVLTPETANLVLIHNYNVEEFC